MKAAIAPAEKASEMLCDGFKKIPSALRLRYPAEMSRVGDVPEAQLQVGSFGRALLMNAALGQFGENLNDLMMAKKIKQNQQDIARCMGIVNGQLELMKIVEVRLDQDIQNLKKSKPTAVAQPVTQPIAAPLPPLSLPQPSSASLFHVTIPHVIDESNPSYQQHQIISVPSRSIVKLVRGNLTDGLGAPYNDYVEVEYNGRIGKISRLVLRPFESVPPAVGVPPPIF